MKCTITIEEVDGKLAIFASIPPQLEKTIAGALTHVLMERSTQIMNEVLGDNQTVETVVAN